MNGVALPPVMVLSRKSFKSFVIKNTLPANLEVATPTEKMDNHESYLSIKAYVKASDVYILTLQKHTSGKLQPLDVGKYMNHSRLIVMQEQILSY